jgi:hypothetical protein
VASPRAALALERLEDRTLFNIAPVLSLSQTTFSVVKTTQLSVTASATDKDTGETLTFSLVNAPAGANITSTQVSVSKGSAATGTLTWTPTEDQGPTSYTFTVVVTDNGTPAKSASQSVTVNTLADGLVGNNLLIIGTSTNQGTATNPGNDAVSVSSTNAANVVSATVNGATSNFTVPTGGQIIAKLFAGNDSFTLNEGAGTQPVGPPVSVDGGTGTNTLTVNGTAGADSFTITGTTVGLAGAGTLTYANIQALTVNGLAGNDSFAMTGLNATTVTTLDGGADTNTFAGTFGSGYNGSLTLANFQTATMQVTGDFSGGVTVNSPGSLQSLSVTGTVTTGSTISATNYTNVALGTLAGTLLASGGSINGATITTVAATGLLKATEAAGVDGSGTIGNATIGTVSGTVFAGSIVNMKIGKVAKGGKVTAQGQGTTSDVSIGTLSGSFTAPEDPNAPAGTTTGNMSSTTINSITSTGVVSTGSISGMSVGTADSGSSITAAGQGTTSDVSIGTLAGSFIAPEDPNAPAGTTTGNMSNTTVGTITATGVVSTGSISGMTVGTADSGSSITAAGQGTTSDVSIGTLSGSFKAPEDSNAPAGTTTGNMSNTTINSITSTGVVSTGSISGMTVGTADSGSSITAAGLGTISNITISRLAGSLTAKKDTTPNSGTLSHDTIGTLSTTGSVNAANASDMTITSVGGKINVSNTLTTLSAGTVLGTANLSAGHFNIVTAQHASPLVNFVETGSKVTRTLSVTPHVSGGGVPDYGFYYDGTTTGSDPRVVVQIAVNTATTLPSFDFGATTNTATSSGAGFDLAGLYSVDQKGNQNVQTGVHNVVAAGSLLLNSVPAGAVTFFGLASTTAGGVQLPQDTLAVAVAGNLPAASIVAKGVPAVAAGSFAGVSADNAGNSDAAGALATGTAVTQANDTFQVFVSEAGDVAQFLATGPGGSFDNKDLVFGDIVSDNLPVTASDTVTLSGSSASVQAVLFTGQGGSLTTSQPITTSISAVSGGSLGNLILGGPGGITANITADSIIGNIDATNGGISGVIKTTVGDLGRAFTDANGNITGVTSIKAGGGGLTATGEILAKGNLVSQVTIHSGVDGVIAADGDIGVIQTVTVNGVAVAKLNSDGTLIRFGGITVSTGGLNGEVIALGNAFGDLSVSGGLSGRIAVQGREEFGLSTGKKFSRTGILGNVSVGGGIGTTGAVVSAALLGDNGTDDLNTDTNGTHLTISGTDKGILAAGEDINFGSTGSLNQAGIFENVATKGSKQYAGGANIAAIDAIFTFNNGTQLDVTDSTQLGLIIQDLLALTVSSKGNLTGTTP